MNIIRPFIITTIVVIMFWYAIMTFLFPGLSATVFSTAILLIVFMFLMAKFDPTGEFNKEHVGVRLVKYILLMLGVGLIIFFLMQILYINTDFFDILIYTPLLWFYRLLGVNT